MSDDMSDQQYFVFPLSVAQERLWILEQVTPSGAAYNISTVVRLRGALQVHYLAECFTELVARHEILRTRIGIVEGQVAQIVSESATVEMPLTDLSAVSEEEQETALQERIRGEVERPVALTADEAAWRLRIVRLNDQHHVLLFIMHHLISDAWSTEVLINELAALYVARVNNTPILLPELPIQYADFAVWQQEWLSSPQYQEQLTYWREQLAGAALLHLPTERPYASARNFVGAKYRFELSPVHSASLKRLAQAENVTPFMLFLAAFQVLLSRYSGQKDIAVGTPIANRHRAETQNLVGFMVNTLVIRTHWTDWPLFRDFLQQVSHTCLDAYANQDIPFERLVSELQPTREVNRQPLFQVAFALQTLPRSRAVDLLSDLQFSVMTADNDTAKFELTLYLFEGADSYTGYFEYNTDLFDADMIQRWVEQYKTLLISLPANLNTPISHLPVLSAAESQLMLNTWNATETNYPEEVCLPQLFEQWAEQQPDVDALHFEGVSLTYRQLNERANVIAHWLRSSGVTPETLVGIYITRSAEVIVAMLAILKAGGAYVPLDPAYPAERLQFMIDDCKLTLVLANMPLPETLTAHLTHVYLVDVAKPYDVLPESSANQHVTKSGLCDVYLRFHRPTQSNHDYSPIDLPPGY